ncbi:AraC family transcriptional regulator [Gordonia sinesedis]
MTDRTVPSEFVRQIVALARAQGVDPDAVLHQADIAPDLLSSERARITAEQVTALVRALWTASGDELLGLAPLPVALGATRLIGIGVIHAPDLRTALDRFTGFQRTFPGLPRFTVTCAQGTARVVIDTAGLRDPDAVVATSLLGGAHRLLSWAVGRRIRLEAVELPRPEPPNTDDYHEIFGAPVFFDANSCAIEFDAAVLDAPIVQNEEAWLAYAERAPLDMLSQRDYGVALADRVHSILSRDLAGRAAADDVAKTLAMSPQTLRRRLALEDTSVTQIRDALLRDTAIASLVRGDETIEALSLRLGFSEPSAFRRAFRRWTGSPPRAYQHRSATANPADDPADDPEH